MPQLLLHLVGDYILQSDWMAMKKNQQNLPCLIHCILYTLPFLLITHSLTALLIIFGTHFIIDRFAVAKFIIYAKNHLAPKFEYHPWFSCKGTGYNDQHQDLPGSRPAFLTVWLYIITDNTLHLICNHLALSL